VAVVSREVVVSNSHAGLHMLWGRECELVHNGSTLRPVVASSQIDPGLEGGVWSRCDSVVLVR
jgi:hypothetical protein